jgi:hypothetical protein
MRKPWKIEAVRSVAPEDFPTAGPDFSELLEKLKEIPGAGFALPDGIKFTTVRGRVVRAVKAALNSAVSVTLTDGTVYVELVPAKERKAGVNGAKRGRKPKVEA